MLYLNKYYIAKIEEGLKRLSLTNLENIKDAIAYDTIRFLEENRDDLEMWLKLLDAGELSRKDFEDLVLGRKDVAEMRALKAVEMTKVKRELCKLQVIDLVIDTASDVILGCTTHPGLSEETFITEKKLYKLTKKVEKAGADNRKFAGLRNFGADAVGADVVFKRGSEDGELESESVTEDYSLKKEADYVNFTFSDVTEEWEPAVLNVNEGFVSGHKYRLTVSIDLTPDIRFSGGQEQPVMERPDIREQSVELYVAIFTLKGAPISIVGKLLDTLKWPAKGPSHKNAEFILEVDPTCDQSSSILDVYLYYKKNLLYTARFDITIQPEGYEWNCDDRPITWVYRKDEDKNRSRLFRRFAHTNQLSERGLNLAIQASPNKDEYLLTAFIGRAELPTRVRITQDELNSHLVEMRSLLDKLRKEPIYIEGGYNGNHEYVGDYTGKTGGYDRTGQAVSSQKTLKVFDKFMKDIAYLGSRFCDHVFGSESGQILLKAINKHLQFGDIIQIWIDKDATDFAYPWIWLYSDTIDPGDRFMLQKDKFWGYRYVIEQLPQFPETSEKEPLSNLIPSDDLNMKVGIWNFETTTMNQKSYLALCSKTSAGRFHHEVWDDDKIWENFLPHCDSHILYFFSHGHTAKPSNIAGQQYYDMVDSWKKWLEQPQPDESTWMKEYRHRALENLRELEEPLKLLPETHIRLTKGYLLLRELQKLMRFECSAPLVFLNMCESAQVFPNISGGLIDEFLRKGAGGAIGTEIPMLDHFADLFSRQFFEALFYQLDETGCPLNIGKILLDLRRKFVDMGNPLAFAYTLFGDATTKLIKPLPQSKH